METTPQVQPKPLPPTLQPARLNDTFRKIQTVEQAIAAPVPHIATLYMQHGEQTTLDLIMFMIADFSDGVNVTSKMSIDQMKLLARDLFDLYPWLKLSDLHLVFKIARRGGYGEFYGVLSSEKVHAWFNQYVGERMSFSEQQSLDYHTATKNEFVDSQGNRQENGPKKINPKAFVEEHYKNAKT